MNAPHLTVIPGGNVNYTTEALPREWSQSPDRRDPLFCENCAWATSRVLWLALALVMSLCANGVFVVLALVRRGILD